ncbi:hypothetical protein HZS_3726 [Henneguya salminicola]|nr:hypothetical protein HZS_3726 [Henneguya salminicola]
MIVLMIETSVMFDAAKHMALNKPKDTVRHKCSYNKEWEKYYPVSDVPLDKHSFFCVPCQRTISCSDKGLRNVRRHCETSLHRKTITSRMRIKFSNE